MSLINNYANFIIVAARTQAGIGVNALPPVRESMTDNPLKSKTITLSCGKLTTSVSITPWTGIFMLRNLICPETYFQAAFRVQTPWIVKNPDDQSPNKEIILKNECYIPDFAPDRVLRKRYDGFSMRQMDAAAILEMAMTETSATLLAKRWESALLVNVNNETLSRVMNNKQAMGALMSIEGFRNLNQDIETNINKSGLVKKVKQKANEHELSTKDKRELSEVEKNSKASGKKHRKNL
jgi:hypothetical protein